MLDLEKIRNGYFCCFETLTAKNCNERCSYYDKPRCRFTLAQDMMCAIDTMERMLHITADALEAMEYVVCDELQDTDPDPEWCAEHCDNISPGRECYLHWAELRAKAMKKEGNV